MILIEQESLIVCAETNMEMFSLMSGGKTVSLEGCRNYGMS